MADLLESVKFFMKIYPVGKTYVRTRRTLIINKIITRSANYIQNLLHRQKKQNQNGVSDEEHDS